MADWFVSSVAWAAIPQFAISTGYSVGNVIRALTAPAFNAQFVFRCTVAGTSAATEPTWTTAATNNQTVVSGGATFANVTGQSAYGWSAAAGNLFCMGLGSAGSSRFTAGDRAFLSSDHSETSTSAAYAPTSPAAFGVIQYISVNRAGSVPPVAADATSGATIVYNGASTFTLDPYLCLYWQGITFNLGGSGGSLSLGSTGTKAHYFRNCALVLSTSNTTATISAGNPTKVTLDNTTVQFNAVGQRFLVTTYGIDLTWINTPSATLGTVPTVLFAISGGQAPATITCRGLGLSAVTTTLVYDGNTNSFQKVLLDSCRIASGVVRLGTTAYNTAADEVELVNCYDGTNIVSERHTPAGDVTTDKSTTMVGGAQDDVGLFSIKLVSSARCDPWSMTLDSFWFDVENTLIGSARTATVEIISSGSLNNTDISLVAEYQGTAGSSLGSFISSLPSALTASAAVAASTATWNNQPGTPVRQRLQVAFTPQVAGRVRGVVRLGKASTTVWINPQIIIT